MAAAKLGINSLLGQHNPVMPLGVHSAAQDDESCGTTHDECVGIHAKSLYQSLLHGMGHRGGGCRVGRGTFAGLVAEKSSLDAHHHSRADSAAHGRIKAECVADYQTEYLGYAAYIHHHNDKSQQYIGYGHDGDHEFAKPRHSLHSAPYDHKGHSCKQRGHPSRGKPKQALKASEMVLDCTELKAKPNVSVMSTANVTAHQRLCKPFWI